MAYTPTWTEAVFPGGSFNANRSVWAEGRGLFVTLASDTGTSDTSIFTSPDGNAWTNVFTFPSGTNPYDIAYSPSLDSFIALSDIGNILYATDLTSWTLVATPTDFQGSSSGQVSHPTWDEANSRFLVLPYTSGDKAGTSVDGTTWIFHAGNRTDDPLDSDFGVVCVGLSKMYWFLNDNSNPGVKMFSSTDGLAWTLDPGFASDFYPPLTITVLAKSGHYYVGGQLDDGVDFPAGVGIFDGASWSFVAIYPSNPGGIFTGSQIITSVARIGSNYVATRYEYPPPDTNGIWTSDDGGATWIEMAGPGVATIWWGGVHSDDTIIELDFFGFRTITTGAATPPPPPFPPRPVFDAPIRRQPAIGITETRGQFDTAKFTAGEEDGTMPAMMPAPGQDITIDFNDGFGRQFGGTVQSVEMVYEDDGEIDQLAFNVFATGYGYRLNRRRPFMCFTNLPLDQAVKRMIAAFGNPTGEIEFTDVNVDEDLPPITMELDGSKSFCECMDAMCESAGCKWRVDYNTPCNIYVQLI